MRNNLTAVAIPAPIGDSDNMTSATSPARFTAEEVIEILVDEHGFCPFFLADTLNLNGTYSDTFIEAIADHADALADFGSVSYVGYLAACDKSGKTPVAFPFYEAAGMTPVDGLAPVADDGEDD